MILMPCRYLCSREGHWWQRHQQIFSSLIYSDPISYHRDNHLERGIKAQLHGVGLNGLYAPALACADPAPMTTMPSFMEISGRLLLYGSAS